MNWHAHQYRQHFGGLYADELFGPRTYHFTWWECQRCGRPATDHDEFYRARAALAALAKAEEP